MPVRSTASRIALWAAVFALVLRSAAPMLATVAAQLRGVPVGEICEVYGIAPGLLASAADHAHHHAGHLHHPPGHESGHGCDDHCALTALAALGTSSGDVVGLAGSEPPIRVEYTRSQPTLRDPCASWAARMAHGPPRSWLA